MQENDQEFLRALHEEKIRTQNERAKLVTMKLAFVTVLFGLSSVNMKIEMADIFWLIYFVPLVSISYDLYIMSADSRIKRIGIFLGRHPVSLAGKAEQEWERFCTSYRDSLAPSANMFFSVIVTLGAAAFIHSQQIWTEKFMRLWFAIWLVLSLAVIIALWMRHQTLIKNIGDYEPFEKKRQMGP
jgi:hypothetical protein